MNGRTGHTAGVARHRRQPRAQATSVMTCLFRATRRVMPVGCYAGTEDH